MEFCPKKAKKKQVTLLSRLGNVSWRKTKNIKVSIIKTETSKPKVRMLGSQMTKEINKENPSRSASHIFFSKVQSIFFISKLK